MHLEVLKINKKWYTVRVKFSNTSRDFMIFSICRGTFGDWSNKTNNYNIEPLTQGNNSVQKQQHKHSSLLYWLSQVVTALNFMMLKLVLLQLEQPHALYQTVDTEEVGECGRFIWYTQTLVRNIIVTMLNRNKTQAHKWRFCQCVGSRWRYTRKGKFLSITHHVHMWSNEP